MRITRRKSKRNAPATIYLTRIKQPGTDKRERCVYAKCEYGGVVAGPVWTWQDKAVKRVLAMLTGKCTCGRPFHKCRDISRV